MTSPPPASVAPLRVDGELRARVRASADPARKAALSRLLLDHALPGHALALAGEGSDDASLRALCLAALGPPFPPDTADRASLAAASGRAAFELALALGKVDLAREIAHRSPDAEAAELAAELDLRSGRLPAVPGGGEPLGLARRAWVAADWQRATREIDAAIAEGAGPALAEALLLRATLARRAGQRVEAAAWLARAQGAASGPLPALSIERLLQGLAAPHLGLRDVDQFECLPWALGEAIPRRMWVPFTWRLRARLDVLDGELGPFRGRVLSRTTPPGFAVLTGATDLRFRLAALRMGLRVADPEEVIRRFGELALAYPDSALVPSYRAEVLHWLGRNDEAGQDCERAIALDPSVRWAYLGLAQSQMWAGDLPGAKAALVALRARHPKLPTLPAAVGELALLQGRLGEAEDCLRSAVRSHPGRWSAWLLLARAEHRSGRAAEARELLARMRGVTPGTWADDARPDDVEASVETQLRAMRGNRSSSFVTLFHPGRDPLVVQGFGLQTAALKAGPP